MTLVATPLKVKQPSMTDLNKAGRERLLAWASKLGFDEERVRSIMTAHGVTGFSINSYWFYVGIIRDAWDKEQGMKDWPEKCPICEGKILPDPRRNGQFGVRLGWKCEEDHRHFLMVRVQYLRDKINVYKTDATDEREHIQERAEVDSEHRL